MYSMKYTGEKAVAVHAASATSWTRESVPRGTVLDQNIEHPALQQATTPRGWSPHKDLEYEMVAASFTSLSLVPARSLGEADDRA